MSLRPVAPGLDLLSPGHAQAGPLTHLEVSTAVPGEGEAPAPDAKQGVAKVGVEPAAWGAGGRALQAKDTSSRPPALCSAMHTERLEATCVCDRSIPTSKGTPGGKRPWRWPHPVYAPQGPEQGPLLACQLPGRSLEL